MTSKVIQGHKQLPFYFKNHLFFCLCYWLIEETNAAEHYERTKFDIYKDDICLAQRQHLLFRYHNLDLRSYGQLFVLVFNVPLY